MSKNNKYFAAKEPKETANVLMSKANEWFTALNTNGYLEKLRQCWAAYHGAYYNSIDNSHTISFGGEQGELVQIGVNHLRNIAKNLIIMTTSTRPALQARSVNGDYKTIVQTKLANGLLDYYLRDKRLEKYLKTSLEYAVVLGAGFIKMEWSATSGEIHDYEEIEIKDEDTGETRVERIPIYDGDVVFTNLSPFDVVFDDNVQTSMDNEWVLCRSFKNKFDLIAKYPEYESKILGLPTKSDIYTINLTSEAYSETDLVPIYEFYHKRTESVPEGRYMLFLSDDVVLVDTDMPYKDLPVYRMAADDILGTTYGYAPLFDLLPIQENINMLYSSILTNQSTFAVQNIWAPRGSDLSVAELSGGLNVIEGNKDYKPEPLNLTQTPSEVFNHLERLVKDMETISGVNSVARGNPEASLRSGNALALIQAMALQFTSGLQQAYAQTMEDVGTGLINILKEYASTPRVAEIAGESNKTYLQQFTGNDLSDINRVVVDISNPLASTTSGKVQMAEQMLQMGLIKSPDQYFQVIETGRIQSLTDGPVRSQFLIVEENERLVKSLPVTVMVTDKHIEHIQEHSNILSDPELRFDPELVSRVTAHMQEHINTLRQSDPDLLMSLGQQPLMPQGAAQPVAPGQVPVDPNQAPSQVMENSEAQAPEQIPTPKVQENLLPNPELQQAVMGNVKQ